MPKGKHKLLEAAEFAIIEKIIIKPHELGSGSYGTVFAAEYDGQPCVAKEMHPFLTHVPNKLEAWIKEINTLSTLKHPSIVQFLGVYFRDKSEMPMLVMERMWKSLATMIDDDKEQLPLLIKTHILYDVACGLQYLHGQKKPVVHHDLSANNVLVTKHLRAKIADLGQAKSLETFGSQRLSTAPGNVHHMAPEALKHGPAYDYKVDIFSFGCTVLHLVTEEFPHPTDEFLQLENNTYKRVSGIDRRNRFIGLAASRSTELQAIATKCLHDEPTSRPDAINVSKELKQYSEKLEAATDSTDCQYKLDILSLVGKAQSKENQIQEKNKSITELQHELDVNKDSLSKKDEYLTTLQQEFEAVKKKAEQTEHFKIENESLKKNVSEQAEIIKSLNLNCKSIDDTLRQEINAKKREIEMVNIKCKKLQQENQEFASKLKDARVNAKGLENSLQKLQQEIKQVQESVQREPIRLREVVQTKQGEISASNIKCIKLQEVNEQLLNRIKDEGQMLANMESELRKKNETINHLKLERERLVAATLDLTQEKEVLEVQLRETQKQQSGTHSMMMELKKKLEEKESKLDKSLLQYAKMQQKYYRLQISSRSKQQTETIQSTSADREQKSVILQKVVELQNVNEKEYQHTQQKLLPYANTLKIQETQLADLKKKSIVQKQQLEEKSYRLSTLELSCSELQESLYAKEEKIKDLEQDNHTKHKLIENKNKSQKILEKDCKTKEDSLKRKEEELQLLKKEHADEINKIQVQHSRKIDGLREDNEILKSQNSFRDVSTLLQEKTQYKHNLLKNHEENTKKLENELMNSIKIQKQLRKQIKHQETFIKEKMKYIEQLEMKSFDRQSLQYNAHWYPYVSLPSKIIRGSAVAIKDKVFVTGGYKVTPEGTDLDLQLKSLRCTKVFCFHTEKCRCDSIASPVVLGGVASVNGQCVLVSGAEGNTLTGNVYVLCEEGSDEQWKKFSEPVPTPRILPCVCCYGDRWLIVCGGYACKEGTNLLETVNAVEILDTTKGKWYKLTEDSVPNLSTILACSIIGDEVYVIGDDKVLMSSCKQLVSAMMMGSGSIAWTEMPLSVKEIVGNLYPFSVVDVNGEPMIIASISGSGDDVTCALMKDTTDMWKKMSEAVECQHCSAVVVTPTLELLLFGGSEKVIIDVATDYCQCATLISTLNLSGE